MAGITIPCLRAWVPDPPENDTVKVVVRHIGHKCVTMDRVDHADRAHCKKPVSKSKPVKPVFTNNIYSNYRYPLLY